MPALPHDDPHIDISLPAKTKDLVELAARVSGQSPSEFVLTAVLRSANEVVDGQHVTRLSDRDFESFLAMLDADVEPNAALLQAAERYRQQSRLDAQT
jgi:uncharacterized protein (DUF1778 family)